MRYTLFHEEGDHLVKAGAFVTVTAMTVEAAFKQIAESYSSTFANDCIITRVESEVA